MFSCANGLIGIVTTPQATNNCATTLIALYPAVVIAEYARGIRVCSMCLPLIEVDILNLRVNAVFPLYWRCVEITLLYTLLVHGSLRDECLFPYIKRAMPSKCFAISIFQAKTNSFSLWI